MIESEKVESVKGEEVSAVRAESAGESSRGLSTLARKRLLVFAGICGVVTLAFSLPLYRLCLFALDSEFYSYILLVPFMVGYLLWSDLANLELESSPNRALGVVPFFVGAGTLLGWRLAIAHGWKLTEDDYLSFLTLAYVGFVGGAAGTILGAATVRRGLFALSMLIFMVPLPTPWFDVVVRFLQVYSADLASWMFTIAGLPFLRSGTQFQLPGISIEVAPECSGIRSTIVLLITSLVGGHMLLRSNWRRSILALAVIPLALLRNGFRIFVISELCVQIGPHMIHSPIHKKGGPIFFALSLIPFFLLVILLKKGEKRKTKAEI